MKKTIIYVLSVLLLLLSVAVLDRLAQTKFPNFDGTAHIYVRQSTSTDDVIAQIRRQTRIRSERNLRRVFEDKEVARYITPGHYRVDDKTSNVQLARMLNNGWQEPVKVVISGSLRSYPEIAAKISSQLMIDSLSVLSALQDNRFLESYGFNTATAYALVVPDTYQLYWNASVKDIFNKLKRNYDAFWNAEREKKAADLNLTKMQVSIVASIVRAESNYVPEYSKIAGVYLNRFYRRMKLQADPTVAFAYDYKLDRVYKKHLQVKSPYNTYANLGLPPGPINAPSKEALDAVLNADLSSGYIYFCASPAFDGTHLFASSYRDHVNNANAFRKAMDGRQSK